MKHTVPVTAVLISVFIASQLLGLALINLGTDITVDEQGNQVVSHEDTALGPRPDTRGFESFIYLLVGLAIGTVVLLLIIRFRMVGVWRLWFFLAVWLASAASLGALMHHYVALGVAALLAAWKIFKPNILIHNLTEVLVYSGIALLVAPIFDIFWASVLLIVIAIYDAIAVWKSRHMVKMAEFQTESKLFAGLVVPYSTKSMSMTPAKATVKANKQAADQGVRNAILGGGDIAFPLLFTGVVMNTLIGEGVAKLFAFGYALIVVVVAATALLLLFLFAKKDEFYPAMPFLAAGCFVGYGVLWLVRTLI